MVILSVLPVVALNLEKLSFLFLFHLRLRLLIYLDSTAARIWNDVGRYTLCHLSLLLDGESFLLQNFPVVEEVLISGILALLHEQHPEFVSHPLVVRLLLVLEFLRALEELAELL